MRNRRRILIVTIDIGFNLRGIKEVERIFQRYPNGRKLIDVPRNIGSSFRPLIGPAVHCIMRIEVTDMNHKIIIVCKFFNWGLIVVDIGDNAQCLPRREFLCFIPKGFKDSNLEAFFL